MRASSAQFDSPKKLDKLKEKFSGRARIISPLLISTPTKIFFEAPYLISKETSGSVHGLVCCSFQLKKMLPIFSKTLDEIGAEAYKIDIGV